MSNITVTDILFLDGVNAYKCNNSSFCLFFLS